MNKYKKSLFITALCLSLPLFLLTTNPAELPLGLLFVPFLLLLITLYFSATHVFKGVFANKPGAAQKTRIAAAIVATLPVLLLIFQSLHQLTWRDVAITLSLAIGAGLYLRRLELS